MQFLKKRNMLNNKPQHVILLITLLIELSVIFVHFPFSGYSIYDYDYSRCAGYQPSFYAHDAQYCTPTESLKSPLEWRSNGALVRWFGDMTNFLCTTLFILAAGLLCLHFSKDLKNDEEKIHK